MSELETIIKVFCNENAGKKDIDFKAFKNPLKFHNEFGGGLTYNKFKGEIFEKLLAELFRGNGWLVDRLGERGSDGGCDLLIKNPKDNSIRFVVQAKNWNSAIPKFDVPKDLSKFQDNYKKQFNLTIRHFCFIAWEYVRGIKTVLNKVLNINAWDEKDIVDQLFYNYNGIYPKAPNISLEPYQKTAFNEIAKYWTNNERCYVEHATGTGKTYIIAKLVEVLSKNEINKILILSPSSYINNRIEKLLLTIVPSEKITLKYKQERLVNLLTYQYLMHNSDKITKGHFSHIIMDEAHRTGATEWHERGLLPIIHSNTKIVGLSATMERYSDGVDIKEFFGNNCAGRMSLAKAMALEILPKGKYVYSVRNIKPKILEIKDVVKNKYNNNVDMREYLLKKLDSKQITDYSIQKIIYKYYSSIEYQKIIVFCEGIEHSIGTLALLEKTFMKFCEVKIYKITSKETRKENEKILAAFSDIKPGRNQIFIIVAIDMLNEGIDVPGIDSIMLFRKTESPRIYLQQIGRVLRSHNIQNPLIFDCVLNFQNVKINIYEELKLETEKYRKLLDDFGFTDIEIPKTISVEDELKDILTIIEEVEEKLNYYRSYIEAKEATKKLGIKSESKYREHYREDARLPSKPDKFYTHKGWIDWYNFFDAKAPNIYPTYNEARIATNKLGIKSLIEYRERFKEDERLPSTPDRTYKKIGWLDWSNFFGITSSKIYPTYAEAKEAVKRLGIKTYTEYKKRYKEDTRLPRNPSRSYLNTGWIGFDHFLGIMKMPFYPFEEAKEVVLRLKITSENDYRLRHIEDIRLPSSPERYYLKKGWISHSDFYGRKRPDAYSNFDEANNAVKKLKIKSRKEYLIRYKEDPRLPSKPDINYLGRGWISYPAFLNYRAPEFYATYEEAKIATEKLGIKSMKEYVTQKRYKEDPKLPSQPIKFYKNNGWTNWNDFIPSYYPTYEEAQNAVFSLAIKTREQYISAKRYKEDPLLPSNPEKTYANKGWISWYVFLGTKSPNIYETYLEAKLGANELGISSMKEFKKRYKEDSGLPSSPSEVYKNRGWKSFYDFCNISEPDFYIHYSEAQKAAQNLGIKNRRQYQELKLYKRDPRLIRTPDVLYESNGWTNWNSFLGSKPIDVYQTYEEAKIAVKALEITSGTDYKKSKLYKLDPHLPSSPDKKYKNNGWIDFFDFFGIENPNKYGTYIEAKLAVIKLKIKSRKEYQENKRYLEDKRLTCNPDRKFKNNGWISWGDFLGE
ncbi:MAG TPA: integrase repeat-containing protein [Prolixibacteraceae bacterium]